MPLTPTAAIVATSWFFLFIMLPLIERERERNELKWNRERIRRRHNAAVDEIDPVVSDPEFEQEISRGSSGVNRKRKRTSTAASQALQAFASIMAPLVAPEPPTPPAPPDYLQRRLPQTAKQFFQRVMLTDDQIIAIDAVTPIPSGDLPLEWITSFDADTLRECGLGKVQIKTWLFLAAKYSEPHE